MKKNFIATWFRNHKSTIPTGSINIWNWLLIQPDCIQTINKIRSTSDKKFIKELKAQLPCITMSGTFTERNSESLINHNGLIAIDIDGSDNPHIQDMEALKLQLSQLPYMLYAGLSVSGKGVFCVIQIAFPEKHLEHFHALEADFRDMGINIDPACKDIVRLRYRSWDSNPIINEDAPIYEKCTDTSLIVKLPKSTVSKPKLQTFHTAQSVQIEEIALSIEDQFLLPTIDDNTVINLQHKSEEQTVVEFVRFISSKKLDITVIRHDWFTICCIIARICEEDGRTLFHEISQFYPDYNSEECNRLYNSCLLKPYNYCIKWLSGIARKYGITYTIV